MSTIAMIRRYALLSSSLGKESAEYPTTYMEDSPFLDSLTGDYGLEYYD